jgi:carboxyl-terminal processing protease
MLTALRPAFPACLRLVLLLGLAASGAAAVRAGTADAQLEAERAQARAMLRLILQDLRKHYYDPGFRGLDLDARFAWADRDLAEAATLHRMRGIVAQAVLDLEDSHTRFLPPRLDVQVEYGWRMRMIGETCHVVAVRPGSDAQAQGLCPGDVLLAVDGFRPDRRNLWKMLYRYQVLRPVSIVKLRVQRPGSAPREIGVATEATPADPVYDVDERFQASVHSARPHRFHDRDGVLIWKLPQFAFDRDRTAPILEALRNRSALVLDLRGNPGGSVELLEWLIGYFFPEDVTIATFRERKRVRRLKSEGRGKKRFRGELVVLVDSESASAAELFARTVQLQGRGIVVGDRTAGAVRRGRVYNHEIPAGAGLSLSFGVAVATADAILPDGRALERVGVMPDLLVLPTAQDLAWGSDPALAVAAGLVGLQLDPFEAGTLFPVEWTAR